MYTHTYIDTFAPMDVEEDPVAEVLREIMEHGLKTGNFEDSELTQRLVDKIRRDDALNPRTLRKKDKQAARVKERVKGIPSSSESSDESSEELVSACMRAATDAFNPTVKSSVFKKPFEDDTPVYEEVISSASVSTDSEEECELVRYMTAMCLKTSVQEREDQEKEALAEVKRDLDAMGVCRDRLLNPAWRSMFLMTNASEILDESVLGQFLDEYIRTGGNM